MNNLNFKLLNFEKQIFKIVFTLFLSVLSLKDKTLVFETKATSSNLVERNLKQKV